MKDKGELKTSDIADMLGLSEARTRVILQELIKDGKVISSGKTKKKKYCLK